MKKGLLLLILLVLSCSQPETLHHYYFDEVIFIDHHNLRYVKDEATIKSQVAEIKKNLDKAAEYGLDTYLLFAKDTFEAMLKYDFEVDGIGNIGKLALSSDKEHIETGKYLRKALKDILKYAKKKHIRIFFHSNQFIFPEKVLETVKPKVWGTAVCPGRKTTWEIYNKKLEEFLKMFPDIAGFQVTGDETQVSVLECHCDSCQHLSFVDRVNLLTKKTAAVCEKHGKEVQMRTWQRMGELEQEKHPSHMADGLPDNVFFSIKNTVGDFHITHPVDDTFLRAVDSSRVVVEFDAWREYSGHNYFPCYMGDIWAPRFKLLKQLGIKRVAVRLMWNSNENLIFEKPWGNFINIYTFLKLAENPDMDPNDILKQFVAEYYPERAQNTAYQLYKLSQNIIKVLYYPRGIYYANHSRIQDDDALNDLKALQEKGYLTEPEHFERRQYQIRVFCGQVRDLIYKIKSFIPQELKESLEHGIKVLEYVALGTTDKMEILFWQQKGDETKVTEIKNRIHQRIKEWKTWDPVSFVHMNGEDMLEDL